MSVRVDGKIWNLDDTVERALDDTVERALDDIEKQIDGMPGDPGPLYDINERVRRVIVALQAMAKQ